MSNDSEPIVTTVEELAAHDRKIAAKALQEAAEALPFTTLVRGMFDQPAPSAFQHYYKGWLVARAAAIKAGVDV